MRTSRLESFDKVIDGFAAGNPPKPGPQIDRQLLGAGGRRRRRLKETTLMRTRSGAGKADRAGRLR